MCPKDSLGVCYPLIYHDHHREGDPLRLVLASMCPIAVTARNQLTLVHGDTTNRRTDVQPPAPSSLAELPIMVMGVARDANGSARVLADSSDLAALEPNVDVLARHDLDSALRRLLILALDNGIGARAPAEDRASLRVGPNVEDGRANRDQVHGEAVPPVRRLGGQDTGIDHAAHAVEQLLGDARPVAVDHVAGPHTLRGDDVRLLAGGLLVQQRDVRTPVRVVLDALDEVRPGKPAVEVDRPYPPLVAASAMPHGDLTKVVPATLGHALLGEGQRQERPTLPQMVIDGSLQMPHTGGPGLVGAEDDGGLPLGLGLSGHARRVGRGGLGSRLGGDEVARGVGRRGRMVVYRRIRRALDRISRRAPAVRQCPPRRE